MTGSGTETSIGTILSAFASYGQRVALTHSRGQWTFQDLLDEVHRTTRALQRRGVGPGGGSTPAGGESPGEVRGREREQEGGGKKVVFRVGAAI